MTEDLPQVLDRFCLVLPHITWACCMRLDLSSSYSMVLKCLSHAEQTQEQGTLPSLLPVYFPAHSELVTRDTDTFGSCVEVRSIVSLYPLALKQVMKHLNKRPKRSMVHCLDSEYLFVFHGIVLFASLVCSISGK